LNDFLFILSQLNWLNVLDILLVSLIFFGLFTLIQGTRAMPLLRGVVIIVVVAVVVSNLVQLTAVSWLIRNALPALLVAVPVVFQPELRRLLERLGSTTGGFLSVRTRASKLRDIIETVTQACIQLSRSRYGALIVLEREVGLQDIIETGVSINGEVSRELLLTLFFPRTPLHDGAVIIRGDRIVAASAVLPISTSTVGDVDLGTRHRAALGISEISDAIAVVVSEETGIISIAYGGRLIRRLDESRLAKVLTAVYRPQIEQAWPHWLMWLRGRLGLKERTSS
jgi:diadenylate cyclase